VARASPQTGANQPVIIRIVTRLAALVLTLGAAGAAAVPPEVAPGGARSKREDDVLRQKVATITAHAERPSKEGRRTTITENEVNSYLVYDAREQLPAGVVEPSVTILGTGRLAGRAVWAL